MKLRDRIYLLAIWLMPLGLMACTKSIEVPIIKHVPVEVKVPVTVPCVKDKPSEVTPLRDRLPAADWRGLTTDQRENLLASQSLDRKAYGDRLNVATAGCL